MSKKEYYTSVSVRYGKVLYRGYSVDENGMKRRTHAKLAYGPTLYLECNDTESPFKSLYGKPLQEKRFDSIPEAREYIKSYKDVREIYGYAQNRFEYAFLAQAFPDILEVGIDDVTVGTIDIETTVEHGKMDTVNVPEEILLITYQNLRTKKLITWGSRLAKVENYVLCKDESDLLRKFIRHVSEDDPDILTGWHSNGFDIPYIINKSNKLLGEEETNKLSPFGIIEMQEEDIKGKTVQKFTIVGRSCLDMLEIYKKFTFVKRESYKLENIATTELGVGKLENPWSSFREWYEQDFTQFTKYNQIDVLRVSELEDKLGLISLVMSLAYLTKSNLTDCYSPVKYWECYILSTLSNENIFCSLTRQHSASESLDGAYVMDVVPGFYDWIISIDGASLYPSIIRGLNMSPDTILGKNECTIDSMLTSTIPFKGSSYTVAANGAMFSNANEGVMPRLVGNVLNGRSVAKKAMLIAKQEYENTHDPKFKKIVDLQNTLQAAYKVAANSLFGICGNAGFIFYDHRIAEGITHTGQYILKFIGTHVNKRMNEFFKTENNQYLFYCHQPT